MCVWSRADFSNSLPYLAQPQRFASKSPSEAGGTSVLTQPSPGLAMQAVAALALFSQDSSLLTPDQVRVVLLKERHHLTETRKKRSRLTKFCSQRPWNCWNFCDISNCALPTALRTFPKTAGEKKKKGRKRSKLNRLLVVALSSCISGAKKHWSHQKRNFRDPQGTNCSQEQEVLNYICLPLLLLAGQTQTWLRILQHPNWQRALQTALGPSEEPPASPQ